MNILLFDSRELQTYLPPEDLRVKHIKEVLRMSKGSQLFVGIINGARGKATIVEDNNKGLFFEIDWEPDLPKSLPITLIVGLPRPQTGRKILEECTSLGVSRIFFFASEKGEPSYATSKLWQTDEWKRHLIKGAEQAFTTRIPEVTHFEDLRSCLHFLKAEDAHNTLSIALDNYEAPLSLTQTLQTKDSYTLAIGSERGWSKDERNLLRESKFALAHLGDRVLRMETACVSGVALISSRLGVM